MSYLIKTIQNKNIQDFEDSVNAFAKNNAVRATQTHVVLTGNSLTYTAVVFYEEKQ